ncbi:FHA domain-containing protein [Waterburya agarophytonicola K14]|uniref:FHA domain-containing protein n=1 Tax=Waterburya agarophytonicola KI4 TaxID=2874699 RepID=A0A964BP56_9CYAN|nr:FHA domain-containing protein [Waterburya agarophytonicola]MCC0177004.1 FHA domain-containing protein [Waterburya agarophytonicola KI4]
MITCPSCNHQNPEGSLQCENCYTPLPASTSCPNCGTSVQTDATFCGQCGFNLQAENPVVETAPEKTVEETAIGSLPDLPLEELSPTVEIPEVSVAEVESDILPETTMSSPITSPWDEEEDLTIGQPKAASNLDSTEIDSSPVDLELPPEFITSNSDTNNNMPVSTESTDLDLNFDEVPIEEKAEIKPEELEVPEVPASPSNSSFSSTADPDRAGMGNISGMTQLQLQTASLLHLQSNTTIEIPANLNVVHIGKPNGQIPPDIDVAGFPDSEVVSRLHADIRIEGDIYYIEDVGSSNGTYVNHTPLLKGNRHRLRAGDRIALGKGDLVTFIFQLG